MLSSTPAGGKRPKNRRSMWSGVVLAKYWALQLPATALLIVVLLGVADFFVWPQWVVWTIVALWVAKDAILYPLVWRSYDPSDSAALPYSTEGASAVAIERIDPSGRVRIWGELWHAELSRGARRIEKGETVRVNARHGLTLLVEAQVGQQEIRADQESP
jgi:membrane protein implicated in regulation of membrane protease activity